MENLPEHYIEDVCPGCGEIVEFTKQQLSEFDGHHLEFRCPHCNRLCCFTCQYVYSGEGGPGYWEQRSVNSR